MYVLVIDSLKFFIYILDFITVVFAFSFSLSLSLFGILIELRKPVSMGIFQKYLKHYIQQRTNLKSKLTSLQISCNEKSRKIGTKLCKFLDNVICKRQLQVEGNSSINEKDRFSTPLMVEQQFFPSLISDSETGDGHGSIIPTYVCEICVEPKPLDISFNIKGCSHFYCIECTVKYIKSKLDDNVSRIQCPVTDCEGVLDPDFCREILPRDLFNRWGKALCESALLGSEKLYCPYKDCSALLVNDGEKRIKRFPCPLCKRVFCVQCKVAWHSGADCIKFQKLKNLGSDAMLVDLAKRKKWRQCPNCSIYVEKSAGCCYVKCRCGNAFCYNCGAKSNKATHFCTKCYH